MSQVEEYSISGTPLTMAGLKVDLDAMFAAAASANRGATAPDNPFEGMHWWDSSANPEILKRYTVAGGWASLLSVNITTGAVVIVAATITNTALKLGRDADNQADWGTDDHLKITIAGVEYDLTTMLVAATPVAIGETTPNIVRGTNREVFKVNTAASPLTAPECSGTIVSNYGMTDADCTIDLPTAVEGLSFVCILPAVRAKFFKLHCPTAQADKIYLLGVAGSDDGNVGVASGYSTGAACSFFTFKASDGGFDWFAIPIFGSWVAS